MTSTKIIEHLVCVGDIEIKETSDPCLRNLQYSGGFEYVYEHTGENGAGSVGTE